VISVPPPSPVNSYQRLLYEQLYKRGITLASAWPLSIGWLRRHRGSGTIVHVHWPAVAYAPDPRPAGLRGRWQLWLGVARFGVWLTVARALGYRIVWTVHEVLPPDSPGRAHRVAAGWLARASHTLIVHDRATMDGARRLPTAAGKLVLIPHASYIGVYPRGRPGGQVRSELGLGKARFVFLYFGMLRPYKQVPLLLEAFARTREALPDAGLVIAGEPRDEGLARDIERAAADDPRIKPVLRFVADHELAELFDAADACVYPRGDGGTAGTLLLALSLDTPVVAARTPTYRELLDEERCGWLFTPDDPQSLAETLIRAADPGAAAVRGMRAAERVSGTDWPEVGRLTADLLLAD
jgi:glycosyltransferase involved in cell wall biosynthesis